MPLQIASIPNPSAPIVETNTGIATLVFRKFLELLVATVNAAVQVLNGIPGVNNFTIATQPTLGPSDAGFLGRVTDVDRQVTWDGTAWQPYGGDEGGRFEGFAIAPSGVGWALCNGTGTTILGGFGTATLVLNAFTTPNLTGTPSYLKSAAAYTGVVNPASGTTAGGVTGTGTTGSASSTLSGNTDAESATQTVQAGAGATVPATPHFHGTSGIIVVAHTHPQSSLSVPGLGPGTLDLANLGVLPYVRR